MAVKRSFGLDSKAIQGSLSDTHRNYLVIFLSELAGTFLFLFFAFSIAQVANTPVPDNPNGPPNLLAVLFIALGFGCSVAVNVWLFYRISGGMFNPAIALTLVLIGAIPASRGVVVFVAQMIGAIAAAAAVSATLPGPMAVNVRLGGDASVARGLFVEMFATLQLVFSVVMLAAVKHKATYLAPIGIGIATFIGHMCSIYYTGAGMNPARAFAPDVVAHSFPSYQWIYWLGPALGALVAAGYYRLLELLNWMTANPGQDYDDLETQIVEPWKSTLRPNVALQQASGRPLLRSSTDKEVKVSSPAQAERD